MWNKRKEDEYPPRSASTSPSSANVERETHVPMSPASTAGYNTVDRGAAMIGKSVMIKGQIFSREDLTMDGEMEGSIELLENRLTIGPHGKVNAGIKAREVVVLGILNGNVEASDKLDIRKDARLVGDIKTARIVIEDGAYFKGSIDIIRAEPKPAPAQQAPKPAPAQHAGQPLSQQVGQPGAPAPAPAPTAPTQTFAASGGGTSNTGAGERKR